MKKHELIITPKTKVANLLDNYPQLEDDLINYVPAFKKLRNPVLRKTVAKITTLQQAAAVGNVKVEDLINFLRKKVGQEAVDLESDMQFNTKKPGWFDESRIKNEIDIREILNAGEQPVNQVVSDMKKLERGDILPVIAPFIPAPLIDKSLSLEMDHWLLKESDEKFIVYFKKR
ncbi:MAG: DUF1858 domain-containing protein [Candidatus Kapaibacterium sp.]